MKICIYIYIWTVTEDYRHSSLRKFFGDLIKINENIHKKIFNYITKIKAMSIINRVEETITAIVEVTINPKYNLEYRGVSYSERISNKLTNSGKS